jgi:hypothetical protein
VIHTAGLIHRDIKPSNLWLEAPDGRIKILDLGLARPLHAEANLTQTGLIVGTPAFMSPEQARGEALDPRTDIFSLGCVLYSLCTGLQPFDGETTMAVLTALAVENPKPPHEHNPAIPAALSDLIMRCLSKDARWRPTSADEIAQELRQLESLLSTDADVPVAVPIAADGSGDTSGGRPGSGTEALPRRSKKSKRRKKRASGAKLWVPIIMLAVLLTAALTFAAVKIAGRLSGPPEHPPGPGRSGLGPGTTVTVGTVFLTDMTPSQDHRFGPSGFIPPAPPGKPPFDKIPPLFEGRRLDHGILMHPDMDTLSCDMTFALGGRFTRFRTDVCLNETGTSNGVLTFRVYGDGNSQPLWEAPVRSHRDKPSCDISVIGVDRLRLVVTATDSHGAHALWIDPRLEK